jgi:hypothetical protein
MQSQALVPGGGASAHAMAFPLQFILENVLRYTLMAKDKKKKSKKDKASEDILDTAALSIKKFRKVTKQIGKLSTGQKLVGGIALAAAGLAYLATRDSSDVPADNPTDDAPGRDDDPEPRPSRKIRKPHRGPAE